MNYNLWLSYVAASFVICILPGPGAVLSMTNSMKHGFRRTFVSTLGLQLGIWVHMAIASFGVASLITASVTLFNVVKWGGVAYFIFTGVRTFFSKERVAAAENEDSCSRRGLLLQGVLTNISNPKAIIFFIALFPQFIDCGAPNFKQFLILAVTFSALDVMCMSFYSATAKALSPLFQSERGARYKNRFVGTLFLLIGILLVDFKK